MKNSRASLVEQKRRQIDKALRDLEKRKKLHQEAVEKAQRQAQLVRARKQKQRSKRQEIELRKAARRDLWCRDCKDGDGPTTAQTRRPAPHPGPRCWTHHKVVLANRKVQARELRMQRTYGLLAGEHDRLMEAQGGRCAVRGCGRKFSKRVRPQTDHVHAREGDEDPRLGRNSVRGLLCKTCNTTLGRLRDNAARFRGLAEYVEEPPAYKVLGTTGWETRHERQGDP